MSHSTPASRPFRKARAPKDGTERQALAQRAYDTKFYAAATSLWAAALAADPKLAAGRQGQHCYNAACATALAAAGQGNDNPPPEAAARTRLRGQALGWLQADLAAWRSFLERATPAQRTAVLPILRHWQQDTALAGLRDAGPAKPPDAEREAWQSLWSELAVLVIGLRL